jgi:hypothetical protein
LESSAQLWRVDSRIAAVDLMLQEWDFATSTDVLVTRQAENREAARTIGGNLY